MAEQTENTSKFTRKKLLGSRLLRWILGILASLLLVLYVGSFFLDEPLRKIMEKNINRDLKGYSVRLPEAHFQLLGLSLTLRGLVVQQQAHPEPPVAIFPSIKAGIHWREIFSGKLVAELALDEPKLNINLQQLQNEAESEIPLKEKGWQQAVADIYPLKINALKIKNASVTYLDLDTTKPFVLSHLNLQASNIRNINLPDKVYPSSFHLDTAIFGSGHGSIDGKANFLAKPIPAFKAAMELEKVPLDYFKQRAASSNLAISGGLLSASGNVEYTPNVQVAHLKELLIQGMKIDYIHTKETAGAEKKRAVIVGKAAKKINNKQGLLISADELKLADCNMGFVNNAARHPYRLFLSDADLHLNNFSNKFSRGPAKLKLQGKFMGNGPADVSGEFRPGKKGADMDLFMKINTTQLTSMNDLLRAYGDFDVAAGSFSLVTELHIKNDAISGYLKPFFKDVNVYDRRKDKGRGLSHQLYEMMVGAAAQILENRSRQQVATKVEISGSLRDPQTSTWQIITQLLKNAFFKALVPSFDKQATGVGKSAR